MTEMPEFSQKIALQMQIGFLKSVLRQLEDTMEFSEVGANYYGILEDNLKGIQKDFKFLKQNDIFNADALQQTFKQINEIRNISNDVQTLFLTKSIRDLKKKIKDLEEKYEEM